MNAIYITLACLAYALFIGLVAFAVGKTIRTMNPIKEDNVNQDNRQPDQQPLRKLFLTTAIMAEKMRQIGGKENEALADIYDKNLEECRARKLLGARA